MLTIPGTRRTINPQNLLQCYIDLRGSDGLFTDWTFAVDVLHPCDCEPIVQADHLVTETALRDLHLAGCDEVIVERVDWKAEDAALQEFLDQPIVKPVTKPSVTFWNPTPEGFTGRTAMDPARDDVFDCDF